MSSIPSKLSYHQSKGGHLVAQTAQDAADRIVDAYNSLTRENSLAPSPSVNRILSSLVKLCSEIHDHDTVDRILHDERVESVLPELRRFCAESEFLLERHWAEWVQSDEDRDVSTSAWDRLCRFPYYSNYVELVRIELAALFTVLPSPPTKIAYIGSGPMPLTSICIMQALAGVGSPWGAWKGDPLTEILNIDCDDSALRISSEMASQLDLTGEARMRFAKADAKDFDLDLSGYQVVYLAALVGSTNEEKEKCILNVASRMDTGAVILTRSAWGLRKCLYPELQISRPALLRCLDVCLVVHPYGAVVNSVMVARVKEREA
ncbi:nicotianamine synthase 3 [Magnaporthiopsis poae ATCC 64411]|uniref:Nicotianamine synthase 3 n=1 Tax=Magnaporthiopsis poae (strain ATCC 64411 / 73-15) TaxID=644358 RepID=A0A0C4EG12_MAGP6|nr:nicotianamine synthase 3 [Magnaporthiopsis poae ATCC 64411]